jgi:pimeloyl-ACP methyl ester carboxylesterase
VNGKSTLCALTWTLLLCSTLGCDDPELDGETEQEFRVASDPALAGSHVACVDAGEFGGRDVVIRYPMGGNCLSTLPDSPIVLLLHGNTFAYTDYAYLLDHLAENGFIAVSANILADETPNAHDGHTAAAADAVALLDDLRASWAFGDAIDPTNLAIIGHSRGGMTAAYLAHELEGGGDPWTVRAIVKLAGKANGAWPIDGSSSTGLLLLQGSYDTDQQARTGFENYDLSGTEGPADGLYKAMKLLEAGNHSGFSSKFGTFDQAHVAKGYVLAFLAAHLLGDWTWYQDYIRDDEVPWGWGSRIATQYSDGYLRKVVDNFEDQTLANPTIALGALSKTLSTTASVIDVAGSFAIQGDTWALQASGSTMGDYVQWTFPGFNGNLYKWLSLRIGQVDGAASSSVSVQIRNAGVWQPTVSLSGYGPIETPMLMCPKSNSGCTYGSWEAEAHMGSIRVPLTDLGSRNSIDGVRLVFTSKALNRTYVLDNLEFAGMSLSP